MPIWLSWILGGLWKAAGAIFGFLSKPPALYAVTGALALLTFWGSGELGYRRGDKQGLADCEASHKAASVVEQARQQQVGADVTATSETRTGQSQAAVARNQEIVNDVKSRSLDLPPVPSICPPAVPPALADRLRGLQ